MDIAAMSMGLSQAQVMQSASISVTRKAMDASEVQMQGLLDMMEKAAPAFRHQMDIRA